jgi:hypothetical protein
MQRNMTTTAFELEGYKVTRGLGIVRGPDSRPLERGPASQRTRFQLPRSTWPYSRQSVQVIRPLRVWPHMEP